MPRKEPDFALVVVKQLLVVSGKVFCITLDRNIAWIVRVITSLNGLVNGITSLMSPRPPLDDGDQGNEFEKEELFIEKDMLIQLHCKRGETVTVESYRLFCSFAKYYNKWYICVDTKKFSWSKELENICFLVRMKKNQVTLMRK